ncbi:MAG: hypothetical protein M0Z52_01750 [Actinomycetota bacterium]|nr:hypothetical protein [Actinomycetota bacterium]
MSAVKSGKRIKVSDENRPKGLKMKASNVENANRKFQMKGNPVKKLSFSTSC